MLGWMTQAGIKTGRRNNTLRYERVTGRKARGLHTPCLTPGCLIPQELKPKSLDVRQEELGAMVDKEMAATSAAIEDAVRRIEVRTGGGGRSPGAPPSAGGPDGLCRSEARGRPRLCD